VDGADGFHHWDSGNFVTQGLAKSQLGRRSTAKRGYSRAGLQSKEGMSPVFTLRS
jgi:hypothetical protein